MAIRPLPKQSNNLSLNDRNSAVSDVLFSSIGEGAIVIDERGNISRVNKIALEILGYDENDLIGKWYPESIVAQDHEGNDIPNIERPITEVFLTGKPVFRRIYLLKKNGQRVPVALTVSPVMLDNQPMGAIELFRDITDELQLEHAKDEFISIASHQLRTPASVVKQYLGMIIEGFVVSPEEQLNILKIAYEHNNNQLDIINDLLNVAQAEANKLKANYKRMDLVRLVKRVIESQKPDFEKHKVSLELTSELPRILVWADPLHLQMVIENLVNNANKYSRPHTKVTVNIKSYSKYACISVKDHGVGIAKKDFPKLFNKFSRLENVRSTASGTGLGLYWAKKLVELHKGTIKVESEVGKGTTFTVKIPREKS